MNKLLVLVLAVALATHAPMKLIIYRADLSPVPGGYPAIADGPVICGDRLLERGTGYWIDGQTMRVDCPPTREVSTLLAAWVEVTAIPGPKPVERRKP